MLRMPFCELCNEEEFFVQMTYGAGMFDIKEMRFDKLMLADQKTNSFDQETKNSKLTKQVIKRKRADSVEADEVDNHDNKRVKHCETKTSQFHEMEVSPKLEKISCKSSAEEPAEMNALNDSISRENFDYKKSFVEAWVANHVISSVHSDHSPEMSPVFTDLVNGTPEENGLLMGAVGQSSPLLKADGVTESHLSCNANFNENESRFANSKPIKCHDINLAKAEGLKISIPLEIIRRPNNVENCEENDECCSESRANEELKCSSVNTLTYSDEVSTKRSEEQKPASLKISIPKDLVAFGKNNSLKREEQVSPPAVSKTIIDNESVQRSHVKEQLSLKVSIPKSLISLKCEELSKECNDGLSSNIVDQKEELEVDNDSVDIQQPKSLKISIPKKLIELSNEYKNEIQDENGEPNETSSNANDKKQVTEQTSDYNVKVNCSALKERQEISTTDNQSKSEPVPYPSLKITLIRLGCGNWAVKQKGMSEGKRPYKNGTVRIGGLSLSDERAAKRIEVLDRVKQALAKDKSTKTLKINPRCTNRLKALKRKATTLCAMKSRIMGRK